MVNVQELCDHGASDRSLRFDGGTIAARVRQWPLAGPELAASRRVHDTLENLPVAQALGVSLADRKEAVCRELDVARRAVPFADRRDAIERVVSWIVSWSATDANGDPLPLDPAVLAAGPIPTESFAELLAQIEDDPPAATSSLRHKKS